MAWVFLVIPLFGLQLDRLPGHYFFRKRTLFLGLTSFASGKVHFADQMIQNHFDELELLAVLLRTGKSTVISPPYLILFPKRKMSRLFFTKPLNLTGNGYARSLLSRDWLENRGFSQRRRRCLPKREDLFIWARVPSMDRSRSSKFGCDDSLFFPGSGCTDVSNRCPKMAQFNFFGLCFPCSV